jgi:release factor glutamine methyltransferase
VDFIESDWFAAVDAGFDFIVSNPPYIAADDPHLAEGMCVSSPRGTGVRAGGLDDLARIVAGRRHF